MTLDEPQAERDTEILDSLMPAQRADLEQNRYVKIGDSLVWIDPEGGVRRDKLANLYYIQTDRGVFRVSRISQEVVRV